MRNSQKTNLITAAVIRNDNKVLLVQQQGPNDPAPSWALPGGVAKAGELLTEALAREVREEVGLEILDPGRLIYIAQIDDPSHKNQNLAFVFEITHWNGELHSADPDNLILMTDFLPISQAIDKLHQNPWREMREPIVAYLRGETKPVSIWYYRKQQNGEERLIKKPGELINKFPLTQPLINEHI